jgi:hypothetical protein
MIASLGSNADSTNLQTDSTDSPSALQLLDSESLNARTSDRRMQESLSQTRWEHITYALSQRPTSRCAEKRRAEYRRHEKIIFDKSFELDHITVELLERPTSSTVLVSWHDPQHCSYNYQLWRQSSSRSDGVCALSGKTIDCGQRIYRPGAREVHVMNSTAMILAFYVEMLSVGEIES